MASFTCGMGALFERTTRMCERATRGVRAHSQLARAVARSVAPGPFDVISQMIVMHELDPKIECAPRRLRLGPAPSFKVAAMAIADDIFPLFSSRIRCAMSREERVRSTLAQ